jgi:hypothetical protein
VRFRSPAKKSSTIVGRKFRYFLNRVDLIGTLFCLEQFAQSPSGVGSRKLIGKALRTLHSRSRPRRSWSGLCWDAGIAIPRTWEESLKNCWIMYQTATSKFIVRKRRQSSNSLDSRMVNHRKIMEPSSGQGRLRRHQHQHLCQLVIEF